MKGCVVLNRSEKLEKDRKIECHPEAALYKKTKAESEYVMILK